MRGGNQKRASASCSSSNGHSFSTYCVTRVLLPDSNTSVQEHHSALGCHSVIRNRLPLASCNEIFWPRGYSHSCAPAPASGTSPLSGTRSPKGVRTPSDNLPSTRKRLANRQTDFGLVEVANKTMGNQYAEAEFRPYRSLAKRRKTQFFRIESNLLVHGNCWHKDICSHYTLAITARRISSRILATSRNLTHLADTPIALYIPFTQIKYISSRVPHFYKFTQRPLHKPRIRENFRSILKINASQTIIFTQTVVNPDREYRRITFSHTQFQRKHQIKILTPDISEKYIPPTKILTNLEQRQLIDIKFHRLLGRFRWNKNDIFQFSTLPI